MRKINFIVIHCTATNPAAKVESIQRYWKDKLGWRSPGYHIIIDHLGRIHELEHFNHPTNGVRGHNSDSIHIAYIGGIDLQGRPKDTRNTPQKAALLQAIQRARVYAGRGAKIQGHRDFNGVRKACPSFDAKLEYSGL